ncbi:Pcc1-domain-containing protein [Dissoconium aciculare CBS 342.82]|uniref:Pcc1-domain-containing protein n=1 Tax=Dissoconium aciculare CBS 342.82 TaxID=1314786 RepID=A0A6J3MFX6_9PEZI|nr:Pcc1-domain-containing protein [Dissoconium aciculare CBS 342.82]KAF1826564.1 Pcc1-domain-containing protein [Dissoconium aciculare CBS 342.82]
MAANVSAHDSAFPCSLVIRIPFPSSRLAKSAHQAISVDQELSALVQRSFSLESRDVPAAEEQSRNESPRVILQTVYKATTNRMLRVAVNGFFDSLGTVIQVMEELDVDVLHGKGLEGLEGVQGVEQGMTGTTITGG